MKICVLGSGSKGNAVYIESKGKAILIDQGFSHKEMDKRLNMRGLDPGKIIAILITHEHEDHIRGVGISARKLRLPVYGTAGSLTTKKNIFNGGEDRITIESGDPFTLGPFDILPFQVSHDAKEPCQYSVSSGSSKISIATDLGFVSTLVEQCISGSQLVVIEANHDVEMLKTGPYPWELKQRVMSRIGHLSNRNAAEIIYNISSGKGTPQVILAHLSGENNTAKKAEAAVRELFEKFDRKLNRLVIAPQHEPTEIFEL